MEINQEASRALGKSGAKVQTLCDLTNAKKNEIDELIASHTSTGGWRKDEKPVC